MWCWRKLLRVPWTARRSNQSILKEISPECSLEGLMLKLQLQYFGHLMRRTNSFEETRMLGKIEGRRRRGWQRMRWLDGITDSWTWVWVRSGSWWWKGMPGVLQSVGLQRVGDDWMTELNWSDRIIYRPATTDHQQSRKVGGKLAHLWTCLKWTEENKNSLGVYYNWMGGNVLTISGDGKSWV